jgi:polysaccharide export outer membrane protein
MDATLIISPRDSAPNVGSVEAPAIKTGHLIGAGDALSVMVFGEKDYSGQYQVRPDGRISMPFLGDVPAAGRTPEELGKDLAERLTAWVKSPRVSVALMAVKSRKYYINGEVLKPGEYDLRVPTTVMEGLVQSGGFKEFASRKDIRILRNGGKDVLSFDFQEMLKGQRPEQNVLLEPGDIIVVK